MSPNAGYATLLSTAVRPRTADDVVPASRGSWSSGAFPRFPVLRRRLVYLGIRSSPFDRRPATGVVYRLFPRVPTVGTRVGWRNTMKGHVKKRGDRYYAVIYEGRDPVTGKERRM